MRTLKQFGTMLRHWGSTIIAHMFADTLTKYYGMMPAERKNEMISRNYGAIVTFPMVTLHALGLIVEAADGTIRITPYGVQIVNDCRMLSVRYKRRRAITIALARNLCVITTLLCVVAVVVLLRR